MSTRTATMVAPGPTARFNAWFFDAFDGLINRFLDRPKREAYADLPDSIVEIGPGTGANLRHYRPGTRLVAVEPNRAMHGRLLSNARRHQVELEIRDCGAKDTGLASASTSVVVASLVLCSVPDQAAALREILRILVPGGRLLVVEHVRAKGPVLGVVQTLARRPWRRLFDGCDVRRDTLTAIRSAGFSEVRMTETTLASPFVPANSVIFGSAVK